MVRHFVTGALLVVNSRDILVENADIADASATDPGNGYGVCLSRDRYVTVKNCTCANMRHGFIVHAGSTDVVIQNCTANGCSFDAHGMDDRRINISNCATDTGCEFGNPAWGAGDQTIDIDSSNIGGQLVCCAYLNGLTVTSSTLARIEFSSDIAGLTKEATNQGPTSVLIKNCVCSADDTLIQESPQSDPVEVGTALFTGCTFNSTRTAWGNILVLKNTTGTIEIEDSTMNLSSTRGDIPVQITDGLKGLTFVVSATKLNSAGPSLNAASFGSSFAGRGQLTNNVLTTSNKKATFLANASKVSVSSSNNTVKLR